MAFDYRTPFPASVPANVPEFRRTFQHENWIDGESVVQAETNEMEEGFNSRLHKIEADLDALSRDTGRAFAALAEMRASLSGRLDELRTEVQRLDQSTPWESVALESGWRTSIVPQETPLGYRKDRSGVVHLRGHFFRVFGSENPLVFYLPPGFRPEFIHRFPVAAGGAGDSYDRILIVSVTPAGSVLIPGTVGEVISIVSIDGVSFWPRIIPPSTPSAGFRDDPGIGGDQL